MKYKDFKQGPFISVLAASSALLCACLAPHYTRPTVNGTAAAYQGLAQATTGQWVVAAPSDALSRGKWWQIFGDKRLDGLEEKAFGSNQTILEAKSQLDEAMAVVSAERSEFFPSFSVNPSAQRNFASSNLTAAQSVYYNSFELPFEASWAVNPYAAYNAFEGAKASAQAQAAALANTRLSIGETLASDYFALEATDMELSAMSASTGAYSEALTLTTNQYQGGVASEANVVQAKAQLQSALAQESALSITRAQYEHAIAVLVGQSPSSFDLSTGTILAPPPPIPVAVPSLLLERRPDIAEAERQVIAADKSVGLARSAFFPSLSLTATVGEKNPTLEDLFTLPSQFWSLGAALSENIFEFGYTRAEIREAWAAYHAAIAAYRQTVLSAFQGVEDELTGLEFLSQEQDQQDAATKAAERSADLEMIMYKGGTVDYLSVIQTQTTALTDEISSLQVLQSRMEAAVSLVVALGGGWDQSQMPFMPKPKKSK